MPMVVGVLYYITGGVLASTVRTAGHFDYVYSHG